VRVSELIVPPADSQEGWFTLAPAPPYGIGVFVCREEVIPAGTALNLFPRGLFSRIVQVTTLPQRIRQYGIALPCGHDLFAMPWVNNRDMGWQLNNDPDNPTVFYDPHVHKELWVAACDLEPGRQLTIDYRYLREPREHQQPYYVNDDYPPVGPEPQYHPSFVLPPADMPAWQDEEWAQPALAKLGT